MTRRTSLAKRKPFDPIVEGFFCQNSRGDYPSFEPAGFTEACLSPFMAPQTPYEATRARLARYSALGYVSPEAFEAAMN